MKVIVFPTRHQQRVEAIVRGELAAYAGIEELTLVITRATEPWRWSVQAAGLGDKLRERGMADLVEEALKKAGV